MGDILLTDLFKILLKRLHIIIITAVLCAVVAVGYSLFLVDPVYSAKASLFADNGGITAVSDSGSQTGTTVKSTDVASSLNLLKTYVGILGETDFYTLVNEYMKVNGKSIGLTDSELKNMTEIAEREDTMLLDITVRSKNGDFAKDLANAIAEKAPEYIREFVPQATAKKFRTAQSFVKVLPNVTLNTFTAGFLGAVLAAVVIVIRVINDQTVKGEEDFSENFDIPILGSVPYFDLGNQTKSKGGYINE